MSFNFGSTAGGTTGGGGFNFGAPTTTTANTSSGGFNFGGATTATPAANTGGFSLGGTPSTTGAGTGGKGVGGWCAVFTPPLEKGFGGLSAGGTTNPPTAGGFSLGGSTTGNTAPTLGGGFNFGAKPAATVAATPASTQGTPGGLSFSTPASGAGFNFSTPASTAAGGTTGLQLGSNAAAGGGFKLGGLGGTPATTTSLGLASQPSGNTSALGSLLGAKPIATAAPTAATPQLSLGGKPGGGLFNTPTAPQAGGDGKAIATGLGGFSTTTTNTLGTGLKLSAPLSVGVATSSTGMAGSTASTLGANTGFKLGGISTAVTQATATPTFKLGGATSGLGTTATTTTTATTATSLTFNQLEDSINKWTIELEEQERVFIEQATKVNAWDRLLIENGEKIMNLNSDVEKVKLDQQRLDHDLDFILAQQRELEEMLQPLEKAVEQLPPINYQQHADLEREHTYQLAENIDGQLKRMVGDLKDIIEHVNTSNNLQDTNEPIHQISKILNAHINSLQWVDQNTALLQRKVDEVAKQAEIRRKEQERNVRLAYN